MIAQKHFSVMMALSIMPLIITNVYLERATKIFVIAENCDVWPLANDAASLLLWHRLRKLRLFLGNEQKVFAYCKTGATFEGGFTKLL